MISPKPFVHMLACVVFLLSAVACTVESSTEETAADKTAPSTSSAPASNDEGAETAQAETPELPQGPLEDYRVELLNQAFETATRIPTEPHIKDRSREQESVAMVALELEQPRLALDFADRIANWRRGSVYAEVALYLVKQGREEMVEDLIDKAAEVATTTEDWRRDNIRVKIAQVHTWLGDEQRAGEFSLGVEPSEAGKVQHAEAELAAEGDFDAQMAALDALVAGQNFDIIQNSLAAYVALYDSFFDQPERRDAITEKIRGTWNPMPIFIRFETVVDQAKVALEHEDLEETKRHLDEAAAFLVDYDWPLELLLPMRADVVKLRYQSGDEEGARLEADQAMAGYEENFKQITDIWRAGALIPLAEAYHLMGDSQAARQVYVRALDEAWVNPNSRPRAEDLSEMARSMARVGFEPDEELWQLIRERHKDLKSPW